MMISPEGGALGLLDRSSNEIAGGSGEERSWRLGFSECRAQKQSRNDESAVQRVFDMRFQMSWQIYARTGKPRQRGHWRTLHKAALAAAIDLRVSEAKGWALE